DLLAVLVERAGRLVPKNELITLVWPGLVVEENNLQVQVSTLRKLLGQDALGGERACPGRGGRGAGAAARTHQSAPAPALAVRPRAGPGRDQGAAARARRRDDRRRGRHRQDPRR